MLPVHTPVNSSERRIIAGSNPAWTAGNTFARAGTAANQLAPGTDLRPASQYDEVIAIGDERFSFEPAVDDLDLEPREP